MNRTQINSPRATAAALALAALALSGCDRQAEQKTGNAGATSGSDSTVAKRDATPGGNSGPGATGAPGLSGSPPTATPGGATGGDVNALPPTAAGTSSRDAGGTTQSLNATDRKFVTEAGAGGMFEVQASKMAADKATEPATKQFAAMLVTDHSNANDELKAYASAHNVTLPSALPKELQSDIDKLSKASGADFDKQYVQRVGLKDHKDDISAFEKESREAKDPQLKAWVDKTLPTLKEHLAAAQKLPAAGAQAARN